MANGHVILLGLLMSHVTEVNISLVPRPSAPRPFRKIGERKMEGGSGKRAYYPVLLRWNVSGANFKRKYQS